MISNFYIRSTAWISLIAILLAVPAVSFGAPDKPKGQQAQAQVLDHAEVLCTNCFFGPSKYYYCFAVDNKILVGVQKVPVVNWKDNSKNYLTKYHKRWQPWDAPAQTVPISYDDKYIWVSRSGGGKELRLTQSSLRGIFTNDRCRGAGAASAH